MRFEEFVANCARADVRGARGWLHEPGISLYVRKVPSGLRAPGVDFDLASLKADKPGKSALTRFLDRYEPLYGFFIENILESRLIGFFERRGYRWAPHCGKNACMYRPAGGSMVSGLQHEEPTTYEWKVAHSYVEELAKLGVVLDGPQRFIVRNAAIEMLIKHRRHVEGESGAPPA